MCGTAFSAADDSLSRDCIDAHVHVWSSDTTRYPLKPGMSKQQMLVPSFTAQDFLAQALPCGVGRAVLIQMSYYGADNRCMLDTIAQQGETFVGMARLDGDPHPRQAMLRLVRQGVRGLRIVGADRAPDRWLDSPEMLEIWKTAAETNLVIGALVGPKCLEALDRMCARFPQTPLVVDHLARIGFDGQIRDADVAALCRLARHKRAHVKVSAFYTLGKRQAPYLDLAGLVRRVLEAFGPQRLLWASDSPFQVQSPHCYRDSIELVRSRLDFLSAADREWLLRKTAETLLFS